ncbi:Pyrimidine-nucleoside phosphorylase, partial [human gut metagenome]
QAGEIMLIQGKIAESEKEARKLLEEAVSSGKAFEMFKSMVKAQGGSVEMIDDTSLLPKSKYVTEVKSEKDGNIKVLHSEKLGILAM